MAMKLEEHGNGQHWRRRRREWCGGGGGGRDIRLLVGRHVGVLLLVVSEDGGEVGTIFVVEMVENGRRAKVRHGASLRFEIFHRRCNSIHGMVGWRGSDMQGKGRDGTGPRDGGGRVRKVVGGHIDSASVQYLLRGRTVVWPMSDI